MPDFYDTPKKRKYALQNEAKKNHTVGFIIFKQKNETFSFFALE